MSGYHERARSALVTAAREEHDFAGWLAGVLAEVAGQLGGSDELTIGRPGSWEASLVDHLVKGTVGHADEHLPPPWRGRLSDAKARAIRDATIYGEMTLAQVADQFGVSVSTVGDIAAGRTHRYLDGDR